MAYRHPSNLVRPVSAEIDSCPVASIGAMALNHIFTQSLVAAEDTSGTQVLSEK